MAAVAGRRGVLTRVRRAPLAVLLFGVFILLVQARPAVAAESRHLTIADFQYQPGYLEVPRGTTLEWTNVDATVHTVSDTQGAFLSGSIHQGQTYSLTLDTPGVYDYFCEPHPKMRGRIVVTGTAAAPAPAAAPADATPTPSRPVATGQPAATRLTTVAAAPVGASSTSSTTTSVPAAPLQAAVRGVVLRGALSGGRRQLNVALAVAGLIALTLAARSVVIGNGASAVRASALVAAALTAATAALHLQLHFLLRYPEPIGTLMILTAGTGALVAAYVATTPTVLAVVLSAAFNIAVLLAFVIVHHGGLFGYRETGWDPSPQSAIALGIEVSAVLVAGLGVRRRAAFRAGYPAAAT